MRQSEGEESVHQHVGLTHAFATALETAKDEVGRWQVNQSVITLVLHFVVAFIDFISVINVECTASEASDGQPGPKWI